MRECIHTSDWWKNMRSCMCCGTLYSDEEAGRIANQGLHSGLFTAEQEKIVAQHERDNENIDI